MNSCAKPMLATIFDRDRFSKSGEEIVYAQPKLDGVRMLACVAGQRMILASRNGKDFGHLADRFPLLGALPAGCVLDGELYKEGAGFQDIVSRVKSKRGAPPDVSYHVFDAYFENEPKLSFTERIARVERLLSSSDGSILIVPARRIRVRQVQQELADMIERGYEGLMVRVPSGVYEPGRRSKDLMKLKLFRDDEFEIVDVLQASGKDAGTAVFVCAVGKGPRTFNARPTGTLVQRRQMYESREAYVGKLVTVRFQGLTKDGIPRFPVAVAVRDYE